MAMSRCMLLSRTLAPVAYLDSAIRISYELKLNDLSTAEMELATTDPVAALCTAFSAVHLWDGERDLGLYRVSASPSSNVWSGGTVIYTLEHMLSTLLDDVVFGTIDMAEVPIGDAIRQLLALQSDARWVLGDCDFDTPITDTFANETILAAIRKACGHLQDAYTWHCDTGSVPHVLHIRRADADAGCGIHYGRSMSGITREMDASSVVTRLYLLGGAEKSGKQVDVTTLTEGGVPYIDADTIDTWGVKAAIYQNGDITDPAQLLEKGRAILEARKNPRYTYQASAIDLYQLTGYAWDMYEPGKLVMVTDDDRGIRFTARIVSVAKQDVEGDPGSITVTIASEQLDELDAINAMASMLQSVQGAGIGMAAALFQAKNEAAGLETLIEQNAQEILLRATWEAHDALGDRVLQAESSLSIQAEGIAALSSRTSTLEGTVTEVSAQLRVNNDSIGALTTRTETVEGRISSAETAIEAIPGTLKLYVKQDELNASISLSGDGVIIEGGVITLTGVVKTDELAAQVISSKTIIGYVSRTELQDRLSDYVLDSSLQSQLSPLRSHSHAVTVSDDGTVTLGEVSSSGGSFNIADTAYYRNGVSAARQEGYNAGLADGAAGVGLMGGDPSTSNITWETTIRQIGKVTGEVTVKLSNGNTYKRTVSNITAPSVDGVNVNTLTDKCTVHYRNVTTGYTATDVFDW